MFAWLYAFKKDNLVTGRELDEVVSFQIAVFAHRDTSSSGVATGQESPNAASGGTPMTGRGDP